MPSGPRSIGVLPAAGPGWLGRILIVVLGLNVALAWIALQAALVFMHAVWLALAGHVLAEAEPGRIARQLGVLRWLQAVAWLGAAGLFLAWILRANRVVGALAVPGARSARHGVLPFLVPGPNLVRIPRVIAALWRVSAADRTPPPAVTPWVAWWSTLCVAMVLLDLSAVPPGRWLLEWLGLGGGLPLLVVGECVRIAAAVLTIVVVARIDRHLREQCAGGVLGHPEMPADG